MTQEVGHIETVPQINAFIDSHPDKGCELHASCLGCELPIDICPLWNKEGRPTKEQRNKQIYAEYLKGGCKQGLMVELARKSGVSLPRIYKIIKRMELRV